MVVHQPSAPIVWYQSATSREGFKATSLHHGSVKLGWGLSQNGTLPQVWAIDFGVPWGRKLGWQQLDLQDLASIEKFNNQQYPNANQWKHCFKTVCILLGHQTNRFSSQNIETIMLQTTVALPSSTYGNLTLWDNISQNLEWVNFLVKFPQQNGSVLYQHQP